MIHILYDLEQGTDEWQDLRKNKISATDSFDLLNGVSIPDILKKKQEDVFSGNDSTERGHLLEEQARLIYQALPSSRQAGLEVKTAGAILNDKYPNALCSPDGVCFINDKPDHLIEIKCFQKDHHEDIIANLDPHFFCQVQLQLLISELPYVDGVFFNPEEDDIEKAFVIKRIDPDPEIQAKLRTLLDSPTEDPTIEEHALRIIKLESDIRAYESQLADQLKDYQAKKNQLETLKLELKDSTQGKISKKITLADNELSVSIYDTHRVAVENELLISDEYKDEVELIDAYIKDGKIYTKRVNTKLVSNYLKAGKSLPAGFIDKPIRNIRLKFNGEAI